MVMVGLVTSPCGGLDGPINSRRSDPDYRSGPAICQSLAHHLASASASGVYMTLPTEPIGSIPRPPDLQAAMQAAADGRIADDELAARFDAAVVDTLHASRRPARRSSPTANSANPALPPTPSPGSPTSIPAASRSRSPTATPVSCRASRQGRSATPPRPWSYLDSAREHTTAQLKQGVISASALSLLYPQDGIDRLLREKPSSTISCPRRPRRSAAASTGARSCRSTSPRRVCR